MLITPANLKAAFVAFDTRFNRSFKEQRDVVWNQLAQLVPVKTETHTYAWSDVRPSLRKWVGERYLKNLSARSFSLKNEKYEATLAIPREMYEYDQYEIFAGPQLDDMALATAKHPDELIAPLMINGQSTATYDGQGFFSASHPVDPDDSSKGTQSNYYASGKALTPANFDAVRSAMRALKDSNGQRMAIRPDTLIVPPSLEGTARRICEGENIVQNNANSNETNIYKGMAKVLVFPELEDEPTAWYLASLASEANRPFVYQRFGDVEFSGVESHTDSSVFLKDEYLYGARTLGAAASILWQGIAKAKA